MPRRARPEAAPSFSGWGEDDVAGLGGRLAGAAAALVERAGVAAGMRVLVADPADGTLAAVAAAAGAEIVIADVGRGERAPVEDATCDAALSLFGVSYARDRPAAAHELIRVVRPGAPIALTAWMGLMADLLGVVGGPGSGSRRWARFETAYLHFFGFPELDVSHGSVACAFAGVDEAIEELAAPAVATGCEARVREALPGLLERHRAPDREQLVLPLAYATVFARKP